MIDLTEDERRRLQRSAACYTSPYCDVIRAKVILLAAEGLDNNTIGHCVDLPRQTVSKWRKRFFHERFDGLCDLPRDGRPSSFSPQGRRRGQSTRL